MKRALGLLFRSIFPGAIAAAGITVAQFHGAGFWIGLFASAPIGWTVSGTWEAASVWLWWRGDRAWLYRLAKWVATAALVGGMAVQSAGPLLTASEDANVGRTVLEILAGQSSAGHWISQRTLKQAVAKTEATPSKDATQGLQLPPWALEYLAWGTAAIMPALYALALLAVSTLGKEWRGASAPSAPRSLPTPNSPNAPPERSTEQRERPERAAIRAYAQRHGLTSQRAVADAIGESPSTLSEFANGKLVGPVRMRLMDALKT